MSDGTQDYFEALKTAEKAGYSVVAFTDHDTVPSIEMIEKLKREYTGPVKWFIGCEISSGLPKELGGGPTSMFHILGLFVDPTNEALLDHSRRALEAREERMEKMVTNLQDLGFHITKEDCLRASGGESVGRPHIVRALEKYPENKKIITQIKDEMMEAAKNDPEVEREYEMMLERPEEQYPYTLFLTGESFKKGVYVDYLYNTDMDESVKLIRDAGGVAVLAHWGTIAKKISKDMLKGFLEEGRLDGVEIASLFTAQNTDNSGEFTKILRSLADELGTIKTIGIDAHHEEEYALFAGFDIVHESIGMKDELLKRIQSTLKWSNLRS